MKIYEARRLIVKAGEAGVTRDAMMLDNHDFNMLIDNDYYREKNSYLLSADAMITQKIYDKNFGWMTDGDVILIDGGDLLSRMLIGKVCAYRAILSCAGMKEEHLALMLNFSETMIKMASFKENRFILVENLKEIPLLFLYEINTGHLVRESSESPALLDTILIDRVNRKKPVILSFSTPVEQIYSNANKNFGTTISNVVGFPVRQECFPHCGNNYIHIRAGSINNIIKGSGNG